MENFSKEELAFIVNGIKNGSRIDLRKNSDERETKRVCSEVAQSDGHVRLKRGLSEVEISIQFKETAETLLALNLIGKESNQDGSPVESSSIALPAAIGSMINRFLFEYKMGLRIDFEVINDDGNTYDLFFLGLNMLFQSISIPLLSDLQTSKIATLSIPVSKTFALIGGCVVKDPTKIEEKASHGVIHIFISDRKEVFGFFSEGTCNLDQDVLANILQTIAI